MMKKCFLALLILCFCINISAQTVAINNTPGAYSGNIIIVAMLTMLQKLFI